MGRMTVLFGYVSQAQDAAFLCADDLDGANRSVVEKVLVWPGNLAAAIAGPDLLGEAIHYSVYFNNTIKTVTRDGAPAVAVDSAQGLVSHLRYILPRLAKAQDTSYQATLAQGLRTVEDYELWGSQQ